MKIEKLLSSVVVIAQEHNPTILHPSFLESQRIVPLDWKHTELLCSPALSFVKYNNGIVFSIEANKFQVTDNNLSDDANTSQIPELARKYIESLKYVRHKAVGINFIGFIEHTHPQHAVRERFLKKGAWNFDKLENVNLDFIYQLSEARLSFSCHAGEVGFQENEKRVGLFIKANYHTDIERNSVVEQTIKAISCYAQRCADFTEKTHLIMGLE